MSPWSWRATGSAAMSSALGDMTAARKGCLSWKTPGCPRLQKVGSQTQGRGCQNACRGPVCTRTPKGGSGFLVSGKWRVPGLLHLPACILFCQSPIQAFPAGLYSSLHPQMLLTSYERLLGASNDGRP